MNTDTEHFGTVVVGGGQAGLATGYHLAERGQRFVILETGGRVGDVWRDRFDSLRLFSPAQYDGLPGMPFPAPRWTFPTKDEMGDYLEAYAARFSLPVRPGVAVDGLVRDGDGRFVVSAGDRRFVADNVVVASGTFNSPVVPEFAGGLDPSITQIHSSAYRNPSQLQEGPVLVVGASHSGGDIAYEAASGHETILSGRAHEIPFRIDGRAAHAILPVLWFVANHVLVERSPLGRKARPAVRAHGGPLIRVKRADLAAAGVEHVEARTVGTEDGKPVLEGGRVVDVRNVVWCTGFGKDTGWIGLSVGGDDGWPYQERGRVPALPGLYFVGLPFLYAFASMLIGGVGRDAEHVADHIASRTPAPASAPASAPGPGSGRSARKRAAAAQAGAGPVTPR